MRAGRILIALAATAAIAAPAAVAAPSDLDPSFGKGGMSYQPNVLGGLGEEGTNFTSLRLLPDGRTVAFGTERCGNGCFNRVVARYTAAGRPDRSYGTPGIHDTPGIPGVGVFPGDSDFVDRAATGLALVDDGGLVLGYVEDSAEPSLVRRGPRGAVVAVLTQPEPATPLAALPDGRVLVLRNGRAVLLRPDGTVDPAVGGEEGVPVPATGVVIGTVAGGAAVVAGTDPDGIVLTLIPLDGSPVVRGHISLRRTDDPPFTRLDPIALGVDASGGVKVLVSTSRGSGRHFEGRTVIGAFTPLGQAEARFGGGDGVLGVAGVDPRIAVQRDGKVVIVASYARKAGDFTRSLIGVRRLDTRGRSDRTFRARRLRSVAKEIIGLDVDLDPRGRIVIGAGAVTTYGASGVLLVRLRGGEAPRAKP